MRNIIEITVNGVRFTQVPHERFVVYSDKDLIPFMEGKEYGDNAYIYRSLVFEGNFYAPKIEDLK
jgi:hypothetical protein